MIDIHTHLLPGVDDGPATWDESLALCRLLADDGVETAVATPHVMDGLWQNTRSSITSGVAELNSRLEDASVPLRVLPGGEVEITCTHLTEPPHDEIPTLNGSRYILVEIPSATHAQAISGFLFALMSRGAIPVVAHAERIRALQSNVTLASEWHATGCYLQINAESVLGLWGRNAAACARSLVEAGLAHAMASDAHSLEQRPPRLRAAVARVTKWAGDQMAEYLVDRGPACLVADKPPGEPPPRTMPRTSRRWLKRLGF